MNKKSIYGFSAAILLSLALVACDKDTESKDKPVEKTTTKTEAKKTKNNETTPSKTSENTTSKTQVIENDFDQYVGTYTLVSNKGVLMASLDVSKNANGTFHIKSSNLDEAPYNDLDYSITSQDGNKLTLDPANKNLAHLTDVLSVDKNGNVQIVLQRKAFSVTLKKGNNSAESVVNSSADKFVGNYKAIPSEDVSDATLTVTKNADGSYHIKSTGLDEAPYNDLDYTIASQDGNKLTLNPTNKNLAHLTNIFTVDKDGKIQIISERKAFAVTFKK